MKAVKIDPPVKSSDDFTVLKVNFTYKGIVFTNLLLNKHRKSGMWNFGQGLGYVLMSDWRERAMDYSAIYTANEMKIIIGEKNEGKAVLQCLQKYEQYTKSSIDDYAKAHNGVIPRPLITLDDKNMRLISKMAKSR